MSSENAGFGQAREICYRSNFNGAGAGNSNCSMHFTGAYDRRKSGVEDRRTGQSTGVNPPYRRGAIYDPTKRPRNTEKPSAVGRRAGDFERFKSQAAPKPFLPVGTPVVASTVEPARPINDRRASGGGRRMVSRPRRTGPVDRRIIRTHGSPGRRVGKGQRAGDRSYVFLPWAEPFVPAKPTLRERVLALPGSRPSQSLVGREEVLDLLKEYGVEDA